MLCPVHASSGLRWCARLSAASLLLLLIPTFALPAQDPPPTAAEPLPDTAARDRILALRLEIAGHDRLYFEENAPVISDFEYDQLKRELRALEAAHPEMAAIAPEPGRTAPRAKSPRRHRVPMLSLEKAYTRAEWERFHARIIDTLDPAIAPRYLIEPKYDGMAVNLTFVDGELVSAATRGDGETGEDITANVLAIGGIPRRLAAEASGQQKNPLPDLLELRGEIYVPLAGFADLNKRRIEAGEEPFASPRNLAAGALRRDDPAEVADLPLALVLFAAGACEPAEALPASQHELHARIAAWGLPAVEAFRLATGNEETWSALQSLASARSDWPFPTDGLVVKLDERHLQHALGNGAAGPRWALAYKFAPLQAKARLLSVQFQVGRTGVLTPVAVFTPVELGGATVARASLHNLHILEALDLYQGDLLTIERAGKVIPRVAQVDRLDRGPEALPVAIPTNCPACKAVLTVGRSALRCPERTCPARLQRRLEHFSARGAVAIGGLGPATAERLVNAGMVRTLADLYRLDSSDLTAMREAGITAPDRLLAAIDARTHAPFWRYLVGLGLPHVGPATAKKLARAFPDFASLGGTGPEALAAKAGISAKAAVDIHAFLQDPAVVALIRDLRQNGVRPTATSE